MTVAAGIAAFVALSYRYNARLVAENRRTEAKAREARANYLEARATIQAMLRHIDDGRAAGSPGLIELRRNQGEEALDFYDRILRQVDSSDPVVLADTIRAPGEAAQMHYVLGHRQRAEQTIRRALELLDGLRIFPGREHDRLRLEVECLLKLGGYIDNAERLEEVRAAHARIIPLAEALGHSKQSDLRALDLLAACHHTYAGTLQPDHNDQAKAHLSKAIELRERPDLLALPGMPYRLSQTVVNLGVIQWQEHDCAGRGELSPGRRAARDGPEKLP